MCMCACFASVFQLAAFPQARSHMPVPCTSLLIPACFSHPQSLSCLQNTMKIVSVMIMLACSWSPAVRADGSVDHSSVAAMLKAMLNEEREQMQEQMREQMAKLEGKMMAKDETIASLKAALQSKTEHRQVQLTAGGEVMQLVSEADLKVLATRVATCEKKNADQDAKLGMTMDTLSKVRKEIKDGRVGAPPALPPSPPPPLPPPRPVATPGRWLSSCT